MTDLVDYLSPTWFRSADDAVASLQPIPSPVTVEVNVINLPDGRADARYRLVLGPDRVRILTGGGETGGQAAGGDVSLTMSYEIAASIARGDIGAQRAFLDGEVRLGGDTTALLGHQAELADIEDRLAGLRSRTRY